ncbi:MAG: glycosyltransferase [Bacteroidetes bacterium]|nr:glycosyltransferase [Bacteroidota bacterium]
MIIYSLFIALSCLVILAYCRLMVFFLFGWKSMEKQETGNQIVFPLVSLVIACKDEENNLPILFKCIENQRYPFEKMEVILVDDNSGDHSFQLMTEWRDRNRERLRILVLRTHPGAGKKKAVSVAEESAVGEWILCTDADCCFGPGWISSMIRQTVIPTMAMCLGPVALMKGKGFLQHFQQMEFFGLVASSAGATGRHKAFMSNGANLLFRKDCFKTAGGFQDNMCFASGDDVFLLHSFKNHFGGDSIVFNHSPDALVTTGAESSITGFFWQRVRWASKSRGYTDVFSKGISLLVFSANLVLLVLLGLGLWEALAWKALGLFFFLKCMADVLLIRKMTGLTKQKIPLASFLISQVIYPFYVILIACCAWRGHYYWKGRKLR